MGRLGTLRDPHLHSAEDNSGVQGQESVLSLIDVSLLQQRIAARLKAIKVASAGDVAWRDFNQVRQACTLVYKFCISAQTESKNTGQHAVL